MDKLRILSLHGYSGNGEVLKRQMRAWAEELRDRAEFVCVDAPSLSSGDFGWWHSVSDDHAGAHRHCQGWARSRDFLVALCAQARFDGVFGFSQGAAAAALVAGLGARDGNPPGFAIMVGGFVTGDLEHQPLYEALAQAQVPSLHLIGRNDNIVAPRASQALAQRFTAPLVLEHDGGHVIAATPEARRAARQFLDAMAERRVLSLKGHTAMVKKTLV
jgi:predicted esterase